jgi:hypothetical protein
MRPQLASSLESQGLLRIVLSPDEVNSDIAQIIARMDNNRATTMAGLAPPRVELTASAAARKIEAIHSSRGILHFHNEVFEKGDQIIALSSQARWSDPVNQFQGNSSSVRPSGKRGKV